MNILKKILGIRSEGLFRIAIVSFFLYGILVFQFDYEIDNSLIPISPDDIENILDKIFYTTMIEEPFTEFELRMMYVNFRKDKGFDSDSGINYLGESYQEWYKNITTPPTLLNQRLRGERYIWKDNWSGNDYLSKIFFIIFSFLIIVRTTSWVVEGFRAKTK